jgi:hypothetical protein
MNIYGRGEFLGEQNGFLGKSCRIQKKSDCVGKLNGRWLSKKFLSSWLFILDLPKFSIIIKFLQAKVNSFTDVDQGIVVSLSSKSFHNRKQEKQEKQEDSLTPPIILTKLSRSCCR